MWRLFEELHVSIQHNSSTPQPTRRWSIMNRDGDNGIRANVCCLRSSKSVSHQDQLFMLAADENCIRWKALYSFCSLSRCFLATLVQVAMNFGHAITPGSIILHFRNAIHAMYDHTKSRTLSAVFRLPVIERYVNPVIV